MQITINKTQFEQIVPAFRSATSEIYDALASFFSVASLEVSAFIGALSQEDEERPGIAETATRLAVLKACRAALPHLDLVLTPTGFGVVSNQNVAPASRERVAALAEQLRQKESQVYDLLCFTLVSTEWATSDRAAEVVNSLLWNATLCRRYGLRSAEDKEIYAEEFHAMLPRIRMAETYIAGEISIELLHALIDQQRAAEADIENAHTYTYVADRCRRIIAAMLYDAKGTNSRAIRRMSDELLDFVKNHKDELPEYSNSLTAAAHVEPRYENKQTDSTYFW